MSREQLYCYGRGCRCIRNSLQFMLVADKMSSVRTVVVYRTNEPRSDNAAARHATCDMHHQPRPASSTHPPCESVRVATSGNSGQSCQPTNIAPSHVLFLALQWQLRLQARMAPAKLSRHLQSQHLSQPRTTPLHCLPTVLDLSYLRLSSSKNPPRTRIPCAAILAVATLPTPRSARAMIVLRRPWLSEACPGSS